MAGIGRLVSVTVGVITLSGCVTTATNIAGTHKLIAAEPIQTEFTVPTTPFPGVSTEFWSPTVAAATGREKEYLGYILLDSGKKCEEFADRLSVAQRGVDTSFDILTVILSALATAFTPLSTVHGLTAAATISTGTKAAIDADVYAKATASLILQEINSTYYAEIDKYRTALADRRDGVSIVPTLEVSKIGAIHRQCSLDAAVANLSQSQAAANASLAAILGASAGASAAKQQGLSPEAGAMAGAAAAVAGTNTATETVAKQGEAAGRSAVVPPPSSLAPGPRGVPGLPAAPKIGATIGDSTTFKPTTQARSNLYRALELDAQGHGKPDPARITLMRQCWNELLHPPPALLSSWVLRASDQDLQAVADCINKAAAGPQ